MPVGIYHDSPNLGAEHQLAVHPPAAALLADGFARGDAGLRMFAPEVEPVLWPEHFDLGISLDEVNYGVSPGDAMYPRPYAYVGPFTLHRGQGAHGLTPPRPVPALSAARPLRPRLTATADHGQKVASGDQLTTICP